MSGLTVLAAVFVAYALVAARLDRWRLISVAVMLVAAVALGIAVASLGSGR